MTWLKQFYISWLWIMALWALCAPAQASSWPVATSSYVKVPTASDLTRALQGTPISAASPSAPAKPIKIPSDHSICSAATLQSVLPANVFDLTMRNICDAYDPNFLNSLRLSAILKSNTPTPTFIQMLPNLRLERLFFVENLTYVVAALKEGDLLLLDLDDVTLIKPQNSQGHIVNPEVVELFEKAREKGCYIMGFTARSEYHEPTNRNLQKNGLKLSVTSLKGVEKHASTMSFNSQGNPVDASDFSACYKPFFYNGIFYNVAHTYADFNGIAVKGSIFTHIYNFLPAEIKSQVKRVFLGDDRVDQAISMASQNIPGVETFGIAYLAAFPQSKDLVQRSNTLPICRTSDGSVDYTRMAMVLKTPQPQRDSPIAKFGPILNLSVYTTIRFSYFLSAGKYLLNAHIQRPDDKTYYEIEICGFTWDEMALFTQHLKPRFINQLPELSPL